MKKKQVFLKEANYLFRNASAHVDVVDLQSFADLISKALDKERRADKACPILFHQIKTGNSFQGLFKIIRYLVLK
tara:strand:- start:494 stop:718 length:225 start_codon:yes stop_codon:yes gene_type:complete